MQLNVIEVDARLNAIAQQRDTALSQVVIQAGRIAMLEQQAMTLKAAAVEFDETKLQRDSAFVFLQQCFQSGRLPCEGVAAISGLNAWIETNKVIAELKEPA